MRMSEQEHHHQPNYAVDRSVITQLPGEGCKQTYLPPGEVEEYKQGIVAAGGKVISVSPRD